MYCKKCGKRLEPGDAFCTYCGTALPKEEIVHRPSPVARSTEFSWGVADEFPEPRKRDTMDFDWSSGEMRPRRRETEPVPEAGHTGSEAMSYAPPGRDASPVSSKETSSHRAYAESGNAFSRIEEYESSVPTAHPEPLRASKPVRSFESVLSREQVRGSELLTVPQPSVPYEKSASSSGRPAGIYDRPASDRSAGFYDQPSVNRPAETCDRPAPDRPAGFYGQPSGDRSAGTYSQFSSDRPAGAYGQPSSGYTPFHHLEAELFREMEDADKKAYSRQEEKFYTFTQKNEEFQKLLDREYEKVRRNAIPPERPLRESAFPETASESPADLSSGSSGSSGAAYRTSGSFNVSGSSGSFVSDASFRGNEKPCPDELRSYDNASVNAPSPERKTETAGGYPGWMNASETNAVPPVSPFREENNPPENQPARNGFPPKDPFPEMDRPEPVPDEVPKAKPNRKTQLDAEEIRTIWEEIKADMERENAKDAARRAAEDAEKLEQSIAYDVMARTKPEPTDTVRMDSDRFPSGQSILRPGNGFAGVSQTAPGNGLAGASQADPRTGFSDSAQTPFGTVSSSNAAPRPNDFQPGTETGNATASGNFRTGSDSMYKTTPAAGYGEAGTLTENASSEGFRSEPDGVVSRSFGISRDEVTGRFAETSPDEASHPAYASPDNAAFRPGTTNSDNAAFRPGTTSPDDGSRPAYTSPKDKTGSRPASADAVTATALTRIWESDEEDEADEKSGGFWIGLFIVVLVIMLAVLAAIVIQKFWPETRAAEIAAACEDWVVNLIEKVKGLFSK